MATVKIDLMDEGQLGRLIDFVTKKPDAPQDLRDQAARWEQEHFGVEPQLQPVEPSRPVRRRKVG